MDQERHKRNYDLHSWSGVALGLFVYIVAFTGCPALFHQELQTWEDPARRLPLAETPAPIHETFADWIEGNLEEGEELGFIRLTYPTEVEPYYAGFLEVEVHREDGGHDHTFYEERWDSRTAEPLGERGHGLSHWLAAFHRELMWPAQLGGVQAGRAIVGIAGVILLLSIVSGVVAHTKIFQELFTLRFYRSMRLKWQDAHKVLGLWGLPFYTMIAVTGAVIGVVALLAPVIAMLTFKGDQEALIEAVLGETVKPTGVAAEMVSLDELGRLTEPGSGEPLHYLVLNNWGDENARFDLYFDPDTELSQVEGYQIDGVTGERIEDSMFENATTANRVLNATTPLHYGTYGGIALKLVYFVLGLSLAIITALGMMMWIERRLHGNEGTKPDWIYKTLSKLTVGVACGLPLATVAIFYADKLLPATADSRLAMTGWSFFGVWGTALLYAFLRRQDYRAPRELLFLTALLLIGLPVLNAAVTGDLFVTSLFRGHSVSAWVDVAALVMGLLTFACTWKVPKARVERQQRQTVTIEERAVAASPAE